MNFSRRNATGGATERSSSKVVTVEGFSEGFATKRGRSEAGRAIGSEIDLSEVYGAIGSDGEAAGVCEVTGSKGEVSWVTCGRSEVFVTGGSETEGSVTCGGAGSDGEASRATWERSGAIGATGSDVGASGNESGVFGATFDCSEFCTAVGGEIERYATCGGTWSDEEVS